MAVPCEITARFTVHKDTPRTRELTACFFEQLEKILLSKDTKAKAEIYLEATRESGFMVVEQAEVPALTPMKTFVNENLLVSLWLDLTLQTEEAGLTPFFKTLTKEDAGDITLLALAFQVGETGPILWGCSKTEEGVFFGKAPQTPVQAQQIRVYPLYSHGTALEVSIDQPKQTEPASLAQTKQLCAQINNRFCDEAQEYAKKDGRYHFTVEDLKFEDPESLLFFTLRLTKLVGLQGVEVEYSSWYYSITEDEMALLRLEIEAENKNLKLTIGNVR